MADDQNAPDDSVGKGLRYARRQYGACERRSYDDGGHAEPAPPQTAEERVRDLEYVIQRVREAVGTDQPVVPCDAHTTRIEALETALRGVLSMFEREIEQRLLTGALSISTVRRWRNAADGVTP